jgi:hypothetical protein
VIWITYCVPSIANAHRRLRAIQGSEAHAHNPDATKSQDAFREALEALSCRPTMFPRRLIARPPGFRRRAEL